MFNKQGISLTCLAAGSILGCFGRFHSGFYVAAAIVYLIALALSVSELVEEYKSWKSKKKSKNASGKVE